MNALERLQRLPKQARKPSAIASRLRRREVQESDELTRIINLPTSTWSKFDLEYLRHGISKRLKRPNGRQRLRLLQTLCLAEMYEAGGLLASLPVGEGKTHVTRLAPMWMGAERPVLVVPGGLRGKTEFHFEELDHHWLPCDIELVSYSDLSRQGAGLLADLDPDLIIADEVQHFFNLGAACTKAMERWMGENPGTAFVGLSGTITRRSIFDFRHLLVWALDDANSPLPNTHADLTEWSLVLDEHKRKVAIYAPGALAVFTGKDNPSVSETRTAVRKRIASTPGVVFRAGKGVGASIQFDLWTIQPPKELAEHLDRLRTKRLLPDGTECVTDVEVWRHLREQTCGFFYRPDPPPPKHWVKARRRWARLCRELINAEHSVLDTEKQVENACARGLVRGGKVFEDWERVKNEYKLNRVPVWVSDSPLEQLMDRLKGDELIWVEHVAVGERLEQLSGIPYFGQGGLNSDGVYIERYKGKSAILSIDANCTGRNLQRKWARNEIFSMPPNGGIAEQLIGRTHRSGQNADSIYVGAMLTQDTADGMLQAFKDARYLTEMQGHKHKLLLADVTTKEKEPWVSWHVQSVMRMQQARGDESPI